MDESCLQLEKALSGAAKGDNTQLQLISQLKEDAIEYCQMLLQIIKSNASIKDIALIELKNTIISNFDDFPPDFIGFLCDEHIELFHLINDLRQFSYVVPTFIMLFDHLGEKWAEFPELFNEDDQQKVPFQIELLSKLALKLKTNADFIISNIDKFLNLVLVGFEQDDWNLKINCIRLTSQMAALDPDAVEPHVDYILNMIENSPSLDELQFLDLWLEFSFLIEIHEIPEDQFQRILQPAFQSLDSEQLTNDAKVQVLSVIVLLPNLGEQVEMDILNHAFDLALAKVEVGEYLDSVPDFFLKEINNFGPQAIYDFLKEKIASSLNPDNSTVFLYIMKSLVEKAGSIIRSDWNFYNELIENASDTKSEESPLFLESCLIFISSLNSNFETQLLQSNLFVDFSIPLIVNPLPEIRHHARDAVYKALYFVSAPISGVSDKIWDINSSVSDDIGEYLTLLAEAIEREGDNFDSDKAVQMSEFIVNYLNSEDDQMLIGTLSIATTLILTNEAVHEMLVQPTIEAIQNCLDSESIEVQANGLQRMSLLFPLFKDEFSQESIEKVEQLVQSDKIRIIENAATCFYVIAKEMDQKSVIDNIVPIFQQWIVDQDRDYFTVAVTAVQSLSPVLDIDKIAELMENIIDVAMKISKEDIISDCFGGISTILRKTAEVTDQSRIIELSSNFSVSFIQGKFAICKESEPLDCDFELDTIKSFADLLCELLHFDLDINELIFQFTQSLITSQNIDYLDIALSIMGDGILYEGFHSSKEKAFIVSYIQTLCNVDDTDIILVQSIAYVLSCLFEKELITEQSCEKIYPVINQWWQHIFSSMKDSMILTLSNLSMLIWLIALKYEQLDQNVFEESFELFPPKDNSDTTKMCNMLIELVSNQEIREAFQIQIALAIARLLILPKMMISNKNVPEEIISQLGAIFNELFSSNSEIESAVLQQIGDSPISQERIMRFIQ